MAKVAYLTGGAVEKIEVNNKRNPGSGPNVKSEVIIKVSGTCKSKKAVCKLDLAIYGYASSREERYVEIPMKRGKKNLTGIAKVPVFFNIMAVKVLGGHVVPIANNTSLL